MEVSATLRFARITPRKMRLVGDLCRGLGVEAATHQLRFSPKRGAKVLNKVLHSAISNAKEKGGVDLENLYVKNVFVDDGPMLKRFIPRAMGRATKVKKKMCHIRVILDEVR